MFCRCQNLYRGAVFTLLLFGLTWIAACSETKQSEVVEAKVKGIVTYKGKPVTYGFLLFYQDAIGNSGDPSKDLPKGPSLVLPIMKDGSYEASLTEGVVFVYLATHPEIDPNDFFIGKVIPKGALMRTDQEVAKMSLIGSAKKDKKDFPPIEKKGNGEPEVPMGGSPELTRMTPEERKLFKEIHEKYFDGVSKPILIPLQKGEQEHNIELD